MTVRVLTIILAAVVLTGCGEEEQQQPSRPSAAQLEAMDARAQSDARRAVTELEVCFVDAQTYAGCEAPALVEAKALTYRLAVRSESGITFSVIKHRDGSLTRECAPAGLRDCAVDGTW